MKIHLLSSNVQFENCFDAPDEYIAFDQTTRETLKLNLVEFHALRALCQVLANSGRSCLSLEEWLALASDQMQYEPDENMKQYLSHFAKQLEQIGLLYCTIQ